MLKITLQRRPGSDFRSRAKTCSKSRSRGDLRAILGAGPRNTENELPEAAWRRFWEQGPEMLKMSLQKPPGSDFRSRAKKMLKMNLQKRSGSDYGSRDQKC